MPEPSTQQQTAIERSFKKGQNLFQEGNPSTCLYIIKQGIVAVRKSKGQGFIELAKIHTSEVIGELAFFDRQPRSASAVATTDVQVLEISYESLNKIYQYVPDYLKTIINCVAGRLREADEMIRKLQTNIQTDPDADRQAGTGAPDLMAVLAAASENPKDSGEKK